MDKLRGQTISQTDALTPRDGTGDGRLLTPLLRIVLPDHCHRGLRLQVREQMHPGVHAPPCPRIRGCTESRERKAMVGVVLSTPGN